MVVFAGFGDGFFARYSNASLNDTWAFSSPTVLAVEPIETQPLITALLPPRPNPARGTTTLGFSLARAGHVHVSVYDVSGRVVRGLIDAEKPSGTGAAIWDGTSDSGARLDPGVYLIRLVAPGTSTTRRVVLLR